MLTLDEAIKHCEEKAEEIRKANEEMPTECKLSEDLCECARKHEQLASWLTELQERREAGWISVKERMPEPRVAVMVYCPERKTQYCAFYADKHWQIFGSYDTVWCEVTHWKPLSKAPESEEENETDN